MQIEDFSADDRQIREACTRVQMWVGSPQLPVIVRPAETNFPVMGDWVLGGFTAQEYLIMNATAVFQESGICEYSSVRIPLTFDS